MNFLKDLNSKNMAIYIAFVAFFILFTVTLNDVGNGFTDAGNLMNILRQTCLIAIMAVGMTFVLGAGQIDLSIGPIVGLVSLVTSLVLNNYGVVAGVAAGLLVGAVVGAVNGMLVAWIKIPSFLSTLGMMTVIEGVGRTLTNLRAVPVTNDFYLNVFGGGQIGIIPVSVIWMFAVVIIGYIVMVKTAFGRRVIAIGGNLRAAYYSGINVKRNIFMVMFISSMMAALAGILWSGRFGGGRYSLGEGVETSVIAAAVLGGTSIYGGKVSVVGATIGAVMIGMIDNALVMYGLDVYQQMIVRGIVIIVAVAITTKRD